MDSLMANIVRLVEASRCVLHDEKQTQAQLETVFQSAGLNIKREHRLSSSDIPDFIIDGVVVEVKIKGQRTAFFRQLERYLAHDEVLGLVLATSRSVNIADNFRGKPVRVASLSKGWL